jgi:hypothetical protein
MARPLGALLVALLGLALAAAVAAAAAEGHYTTGDDSRRPWVELLSWKPRAYLYHNFLTHEECDHIIKASSSGGPTGGQQAGCRKPAPRGRRPNKPLRNGAGAGAGCRGTVHPCLL